MLDVSDLYRKTETMKQEKRKLNIAIEVLHEVSDEFPETKDLIEEKLKQKYAK